MTDEDREEGELCDDDEDEWEDVADTGTTHLTAEEQQHLLQVPPPPPLPPLPQIQLPPPPPPTQVLFFYIFCRKLCGN